MEEMKKTLMRITMDKRVPEENERDTEKENEDLRSETDYVMRGSVARGPANTAGDSTKTSPLEVLLCWVFMKGYYHMIVDLEYGVRITEFLINIFLWECLCFPQLWVLISPKRLGNWGVQSLS